MIHLPLLSRIVLSSTFAFGLIAISHAQQPAAPLKAADEVLPVATPQKPKKEKSEQNTAEAKPKKPEARPLSVTVDLISTTRIEGTLTDATTIEMQTAFGAASIPLSEVAGIRFASADNASTTIVMLNGDSITGATDVKLVTVETAWGSASINGSNIASLLFVPGLQWSAGEGLNGKRWGLADKSKESSASSTSSSTSSSSSTTSSSNVSSKPTSSRGSSSLSTGTPINSFPSTFSGSRIIRGN
ncbi:MAG: hypothetical protein AAF664_00665 [Planctomycetota bacterium]